MEHISSRGNPMVSRFRDAARSPLVLLLLDGAHLLDEALSSGLRVEEVAVHHGALEGVVLALTRRAEEQGARVVTVSPPVLAALSPVRQPSGIVSLARRPEVSLEITLSAANGLILMLADVQDPGNVGAAIRAADACGVTGVLCGTRTADAFGWKALRGSMGSAFRVPVVTQTPLDAAVTEAQARGITVYAAVPRGGRPLPACDLRVPAAVVLGGEGPGLPQDLMELADERLSIPMRPPVESLNVATAAALVAYEAMRQREGMGF